MDLNKSKQDAEYGHDSPNDRTPADDRRRQDEQPGPSQTDTPVPSFDEGERKPMPIEGTANDGVRNPVQGPSARRGRPEPDEDKHIEATMPPGQGQDPKRSTM